MSQCLITAALGGLLKVLRTPDHRFTDLEGYPFKPHYIMVTDELRMHYIDEGPTDGQVILMLHGEPSWSYLYREMVPVCVAAGHRVIVPDLIGFGRSDKPSKVSDYRYESHLNWLNAFITKCQLKSITLFCQDWGGLLGLRLAGEQPDLFSRIVVGNSMLPNGKLKMPLAFKLWKTFALYSPWFPISRIVELGSFKKFGPELRKAYDAPFPSRAFKAGARAFPKLVPIKENDPQAIANRRAWEALDKWEKPFLTCFSNGDPIMRGGDAYLQDRIPGTKGQAHATVKGGHFLQEDSGPEIAAIINQFIAGNAVSH